MDPRCGSEFVCIAFIIEPCMFPFELDDERPPKEGRVTAGSLVCSACAHTSTCLSRFADSNLLPGQLVL